MSLSIADALARGNSRKVVLARITAGEYLYHWTEHVGLHASIFYTAISNVVVGVREDGQALAEVATQELCEVTTGVYYWDRAAGRVYVHPTDDTPYGHAIQAVVEFRFSNFPKVAEGQPYRAHLAEFPKLDVRIPSRFTEGFKNGGGNLTVEGAQGQTPDAPGLFDELDTIDWDAGAVEVLAGADPVW